MCGTRAAWCSATLALLAYISPVFSWQPGKGQNQYPEAGKYKSRHGLSAEDLRKQLIGVPELGLDQNAAGNLLEHFKEGKKSEKKIDSLPPDIGPQFYNRLAFSLKRPDLVSLPWRFGVDSQIGRENAERLHVLSLNLRNMLRHSTPSGDVRPDPEKLKRLLETKGDVAGKANNPKDWQKPEGIPAMMQLLQAENTPMRELLVNLLDAIKGKEATLALANRALFDLSKEVRQKSVEALANRPVEEYRNFILEGFKSPWPAAADHAADAAVALNKNELIPGLVPLLKEQNPAFPLSDPKDRALHILEFVRLNHMCNCVVCHATSQNKEDLVRGRVPIPGEDPPPLYHQEGTGDFVRADITYLRQDFSVVQPVAKPGKWPGNQRYDYFLRKRPLSTVEYKQFIQLKKENKIPTMFAQKEAVLYALRGLTQSDRGSSFEAWQPLQQLIEKSKQ